VKKIKLSGAGREIKKLRTRQINIKIAIETDIYTDRCLLILISVAITKAMDESALVAEV